MMRPMLPFSEPSECVVIPLMPYPLRMPPSSPLSGLWSESVNRPLASRLVTMSPFTSPVMSSLVCWPTEMPVITPLL